MLFSLNTRNVGGAIIVDLSGSLTMGDPAIRLRDMVNRSVAEGNVRLIINLAGVSALDSSGIGELVATYTTIKKLQGDVKLLNLSPRVRDLLKMTKLLTVFDTYDDEQKAITALTSATAHG